jgi:hypothetical protein
MKKYNSLVVIEKVLRIGFYAIKITMIITPHLHLIHHWC